MASKEERRERGRSFPGGSIRLGEKREKEKTEEKINGGRKGKKREKGKFFGIPTVKARRSES